ncbi:MAG: hypothetical protein B6D44_15735 [Ignavibacteriales bacterium UTCHB2]|nr:MAG: hypothetical protein B6D44_15735 [Ignavibacteriales bacterium UTCHB2]
MITSNLFQRILMEPVQNGCNKLYIVSGYATSAMAFHHLNELNNLGRNNVTLKLIIGMTSSDGISFSNHRGFRQIMSTDFVGRFECSYKIHTPPVHTKLYLWFNNDTPRFGFLGSANYTQTAFNAARQKEALTECPLNEALNYFNELIDDTIFCTHLDSENLIQIYNDRFYRRRERELTENTAPEVSHEILQPDVSTLENVTISLLDRNGNLPQRSGLNWGQRPEEHREPNQAYIRLPSTVYNTDFFPPIGVHFTVLTDDNKILICSRAQQNAKAIHTPHNNSLIGEYFRNRLNVPNGNRVDTQDLLNYGRTDITFYKIDDETYYMDFSI